MNKQNLESSLSSTNMMSINGKDYIIKSVFRETGSDIKSTIFRLAERKTMRDMGLDVTVNVNNSNSINNNISNSNSDRNNNSNKETA